MEELSRTPHWIVRQDPARRLVRAVRTPVPYTSIEELEASMGDLAGLLHVRSRPGMRLLLDVREGPFRNDDGFERAMAKHRVRLLHGFDAVAILVKTAVGRLQISRMAREERRDRPAFLDEGEALAWLDRAAPHATSGASWLQNTGGSGSPTR